jgi:predicted Zn-dependent protease
MILLLFRDRNSLSEVASLKSAIEECYGRFGLRVQDRGYLYVPVHGQSLSAARLLKYLGKASGSEKALWMVDNEIFYPEIGPVFGCSTEKSALVSAAGLDADVLAKEALHEVGHLLGLEHCRDRCIMSLSENREEAEKKPSQLCQSCSALLMAAASSAGRER